MMRRVLLVIVVILMSSPVWSQRVYMGWTLRPFVSYNTLEVKDDYILSDYNWRVYRVSESTQSGLWGSGAVGPSVFIDLFRLSLTASALPSYREYKFRARRLISQSEFEEEESRLSEGLVEIPITAGLTLFSGKPFKLYLEGGVSFNIVLDQDEDEPLLSGGDIFKDRLMDGKNYQDIIGGAGVRYKNMILTLRKYVRNTPLENANVKSGFWTLNFIITLKNTKYLKNEINL